MAEVAAPDEKKVHRLLLRSAKQVLIRLHLFALHMCRNNLIFPGMKEVQSCDTACVERVMCTCSG